MHGFHQFTTTSFDAMTTSVVGVKKFPKFLKISGVQNAPGHCWLLRSINIPITLADLGG